MKEVKVLSTTHAAILKVILTPAHIHKNTGASHVLVINFMANGSRSPLKTPMLPKRSFCFADSHHSSCHR